MKVKKMQRNHQLQLDIRRVIDDWVRDNSLKAFISQARLDQLILNLSNKLSPSEEPLFKKKSETELPNKRR